MLLDDRDGPGGAWRDAWESLRLFSPAAYSSLPGWRMPLWAGDGNPPAGHVRAYLAEYERRYDLPVERPARVREVACTRSLDEDPRPADDRLLVRTDANIYAARVVINATGTWSQPHWPAYPGMRDYGGIQLHTADYRSADDFAGRRVLVVGGGNSGAQIAADLLDTAAQVTWSTTRPPRYLPDHIDGRALFEAATQRVRGLQIGAEHTGVAALGDIVAVPPVRHARDNRGQHAMPMFERLTPKGVRWDDGTEQPVDAIIWCTGFRPALRHLHALRLDRHGGHPLTDPDRPTRSLSDPRLHFVGYGDWCGPASATLIGVSQPARSAVDDALEYLGKATR